MSRSAILPFSDPIYLFPPHRGKGRELGVIPAFWQDPLPALSINSRATVSCCMEVRKRGCNATLCVCRVAVRGRTYNFPMRLESSAGVQERRHTPRSK
jgi:hypothetical protein